MKCYGIEYQCRIVFSMSVSAMDRLCSKNVQLDNQITRQTVDDMTLVFFSVPSSLTHVGKSAWTSTFRTDWVGSSRTR
jgi:hypothetical protein